MHGKTWTSFNGKPCYTHAHTHAVASPREPLLATSSAPQYCSPGVIEHLTSESPDQSATKSNFYLTSSHLTPSSTPVSQPFIQEHHQASPQPPGGCQRSSANSTQTPTISRSPNSEAPCTQNAQTHRPEQSERLRSQPQLQQRPTISYAPPLTHGTSRETTPGQAGYHSSYHPYPGHSPHVADPMTHGTSRETTPGQAGYQSSYHPYPGHSPCVSELQRHASLAPHLGVSRTCKFFGTPRGCDKGNACAFSHVDLSSASAKSTTAHHADQAAGKTATPAPCKYFSTPNGCRNGINCVFLHGKGPRSTVADADSLAGAGKVIGITKFGIYQTMFLVHAQCGLFLSSPYIYMNYSSSICTHASIPPESSMETALCPESITREGCKKANCPMFHPGMYLRMKAIYALSLRFILLLIYLCILPSVWNNSSSSTIPQSSRS